MIWEGIARERGPHRRGKEQGKSEAIKISASQPPNSNLLPPTRERKRDFVRNVPNELSCLVMANREGINCIRKILSLSIRGVHPLCAMPF